MDLTVTDILNGIRSRLGIPPIPVPECRHKVVKSVAGEPLPYCPDCGASHPEPAAGRLSD